MGLKDIDDPEQEAPGVPVLLRFYVDEKALARLAPRRATSPQTWSADRGNSSSARVAARFGIGLLP
jgi:hypothetical protein